MEQLYSDPVQRLVADCLLMNIDTAVVSDRKGSIAVLSSSHHSGGELSMHFVSCITGGNFNPLMNGLIHVIFFSNG